MEVAYLIASPGNTVFRNLIWIIDFSSEVFSLCKSLDENTLEHSERKIFIQTEGSDLNRLNTELTFVNASYWVLENLQ